MSDDETKAETLRRIYEAISTPGKPPTHVWIRPSRALLELENLSGLCHHHKQVCHDIDCNVSVTFAKETATRLATRVDAHEREIAEELVRLWPV